MEFEELLNTFLESREEVRASQMAAYMKNQFLFLGLQAPKRRELSKPFLEARKKESIDWKFVMKCWDAPYRELQYVAMDYLKMKQKELTYEEIPKLKKLILEKSWWDTSDGIDRIIGDIGLRDSRVDELMIKWSLSDNLWLRRVSIDHQLLRKEKMNVMLLEQILLNNLNQTEFFINKAMGWILRDYSKTNPEWVKHFIDIYRDGLSQLTIKEGSKYL